MASSAMAAVDTTTKAGDTGDAYAAAIAALEKYRRRGIQPGLRRMRWLCAQLEHPERIAPALHVTGTNGKGSTSKLASALLRAAGRRVGQYTSPHFRDTTERIDVDGTPISHATFTRLVDELTPVFERSPAALGESVTHFDALTAIGLVAFREARVDALVIEVGIGGSIDDTNVIDADVAVVTNVDLDHTGFLGESRDQIAREKAGIIKPGAIAVIGEPDPGLVAIFAQRCRAVGATPWVIDRDFAVASHDPIPTGRAATIRTPGRVYDVNVPFHGPHQAANAACALAAVEGYLGEPLDDAVIRRAWTGLRYPGHFDVVGDRPAFVADVGHNLHGIAALVTALDERFADRERIVVFGASPDKDAAAMLSLLQPKAAAVILTETPEAPHRPSEELAATARALGFTQVIAQPDAGQAIDTAKAMASADHVVVCTGSYYWLGAVYDRLLG